VTVNGEVIDPPAGTDTLGGVEIVRPPTTNENVTVPEKLFLLLRLITEVVEEPTATFIGVLEDSAKSELVV
jgi:hypothetical protein